MFSDELQADEAKTFIRNKRQRYSDSEVRSMLHRECCVKSCSCEEVKEMIPVRFLLAKQIHSVYNTARQNRMSCPVIKKFQRKFINHQVTLSLAGHEISFTMQENAAIIGKMISKFLVPLFGKVEMIKVLVSRC